MVEAETDAGVEAAANTGRRQQQWQWVCRTSIPVLVVAIRGSLTSPQNMQHCETFSSITR